MFVSCFVKNVSSSSYVSHVPRVILFLLEELSGSDVLICKTADAVIISKCKGFVHTILNDTIISKKTRSLKTRHLQMGESNYYNSASTFNFSVEQNAFEKICRDLIKTEQNHRTVSKSENQ